jgi:hypothetical protein
LVVLESWCSVVLGVGDVHIVRLVHQVAYLYRLFNGKAQQDLYTHIDALVLR